MKTKGKRYVTMISMETCEIYFSSLKDIEGTEHL